MEELATVKGLVSIVIGIWFAAAMSACGVSTGSGFVAGSTTYLRTYYDGTNTGRSPNVSHPDKYKRKGQ